MTNRIIGIGMYAAYILVVCGVALASDLPMPSCDLHPGILTLRFGFSHDEYIPVGRGGDIGTEYGKGHGLARQYMWKHPGDWCAFGIEPCGQEARISKGSQIILTLEGDSLDRETGLIFPIEVTSTDILAVGWEPEREFRRVADTWVVFGPEWHKKVSWYGMSLFTGGWILYVRFPEGSCLTGKPKDEEMHGLQVHGREFKSRPVAIRLEASDVAGDTEYYEDCPMCGRVICLPPAARHDGSVTFKQGQAYRFGCDPNHCIYRGGKVWEETSMGWMGDDSNWPTCLENDPNVKRK